MPRPIFGPDFASLVNGFKKRRLFSPPAPGGVFWSFLRHFWSEFNSRNDSKTSKNPDFDPPAPGDRKWSKLVENGQFCSKVISETFLRCQKYQKKKHSPPKNTFIKRAPRAGLREREDENAPRGAPGGAAAAARAQQLRECPPGNKYRRYLSKM